MKHNKPALAVTLVLILSVLLPAFAQDRRGLEVAARQLGEAAPGRQVALLIAVDKYREWAPLKNPVKDARQIAEILQRRYFLDEVIGLYDEDATKANILRRFNALIGELKPEDSLLIYYAGHGHLDTGSTSAFWIPIDGGTDQFEQSNWIPNSQIRGFIANMKARHIALVSDSCFSGDILDTSRAALPAITDDYFRGAYARRSRQVLTSGASESVPDESSFSRAFILAIEENRKPYLDPLMLFSDIRLSVKGSTPLFGSLANTDHQDGGSFVLFLRPEAGGASNASPGATQSTGLSSSVAKPADLMVKAQMDGAEIYIDGVLRGQSPLLVEKLPSDRKFLVEVRSGAFSGSAELNLKPGELREISIAMALLKANLLVKSTESAVRLLVDGEDRGSLGTGIFRDLPAGKHMLELVGADLYWNQEVELAPEATTTVQASVQAVGRLEINAPAEASISLSGPGGQRSLRGTVGLERLPVGNYQLLATGPGYAESRTSLDIRKGQTARWTAWSTGQIEFWVSPSDAQYQIEGGGSGAASGTIAGIAPGATKLTISAPGYREAIVELSVAAGRTARAETSLAMFAPGAIILPKLGSEVALVVNGLVVHAESLPDGRAKYEGIPTGKPLEISYLVSLSNMPELELTMVSLSDGQTLELPLPAGRFTLPWLAEGAVVYIGGAAMETESGSGQSAYRSRLLPAGSYEVEVSSSRPYAGRVEIRKDAELELPGYRTSLLSSMESERGKAQKSLASKKAKNGWGWASLVTGLVGAGGSVASYFLGQSAMEDYLAAETTADATASRRSTELYGSLLNGSLVAAGIGLGLSPLLFFTGPKPDALQRSIDSLDEQIKALQP